MRFWAIHRCRLCPACTGSYQPGCGTVPVSFLRMLSCDVGVVAGTVGLQSACRSEVGGAQTTHHFLYFVPDDPLQLP